MKSSNHFRKVIRRENALKNGIYNLFMSMASFSWLLFEVFTRCDFGERYFRLSASLTLVFVLALYPLVPSNLMSVMSGAGFSLIPATKYITWYLFLAAHVYASIGHYKDKNRNRARATNAQYSLFNGNFNETMHNRLSEDDLADRRFMETFLEPALFLALGIILILFGQSLGNLLVINAVIYSIAYCAAYKEGDDFVMDTIDEGIRKDNFHAAFVEQKDARETCNYRFVGSVPKDLEMRKKIAQQIIEEEKVTAG